MIPIFIPNVNCWLLVFDCQENLLILSNKSGITNNIDTDVQWICPSNKETKNTVCIRI